MSVLKLVGLDNSRSSVPLILGDVQLCRFWMQSANGTQHAACIGSRDHPKDSKTIIDFRKLREYLVAKSGPGIVRRIHHVRFLQSN
jgi:hypothetical protein